LNLFSLLNRKEEVGCHCFFGINFLNHIRQLKLFIRINLRRALQLLQGAFSFFIFWNILSGRVFLFFWIRIWNLNFFFHWFFWSLLLIVFFRFRTLTQSFRRFFIRRLYFFGIFWSRLLFESFFRTLGAAFWIIFRNDFLNFFFLAFLRWAFFCLLGLHLNFESNFNIIYNWVYYKYVIISKFE